MDDFPDFMKRPANKIATSSQATPGVEGYVFDGADGSQMAFWSCRETAASVPHVHDYDEYMPVVQGCYNLVVEGQRIPVRAGEECSIPKGPQHGGGPTANRGDAQTNHAPSERTLLCQRTRRPISYQLCETRNRQCPRQLTKALLLLGDLRRISPDCGC
jgi:mannose-6-phosphate isomerase-like protein (cupin superfamily)